MCEILAEAAGRDHSHMIVCGDFNYPEIDWENEHVEESSPVIHQFIETVQRSFLHQHIREPTRYRQNQEPSLLDLVFTNEEGNVVRTRAFAGAGGERSRMFALPLKLLQSGDGTKSCPKLSQRGLRNNPEKAEESELAQCVTRNVSPRVQYFSGIVRRRNERLYTQPFQRTKKEKHLYDQ